MVALLAIFTAVGSSLQQGGFIAALINRPEVKHEDYNAVFWFNILVSFSIYLLLFFSAPLIAAFFDRPELIWLSRVLFLSFLIASFGIVPVAYMFRNLMVKERAIIDVVSLAIAGTVSLILALNGWGYWGLAIQMVASLFVSTVLRWLWVRWKPSLHINWKPLMEMFPFGLLMMLTEIFNKISENITPALLGYYFTATEAGNFTQGDKWMKMGRAVTSGMIIGIAQPIFVQIASEQEKKVQVIRKLVRFIAFISFPSMLGMAFVSPELIELAITDKWLGSVPVLQLLLIWGAFSPIAEIYKNLVISAGEARIYMRVTILFGIMQLLLLFFTIRYGLMVVTIVYISSYLLSLWLWQFVCGRLVPIRWWYLIKDITPYLLITLFVLGVTGYLVRPVVNLWLRLIFKIVLAAALYVLIIWRSRSVIFQESVQFLMKWVHAKRKR